MRATDGLQTTITLGSVNHDGQAFSLGLSLEMCLPILDFNSTNTSPCRDMTYVVFPDRRKSLATKNLRRLVPRIGRNSLLGNRLR